MVLAHNLVEISAGRSNDPFTTTPMAPWLPPADQSDLLLLPTGSLLGSDPLSRMLSPILMSNPQSGICSEPMLPFGRDDRSNDSLDPYLYVTPPEVNEMDDFQVGHPLRDFDDAVHIKLSDRECTVINGILEVLRVESMRQLVQPRLVKVAEFNDPEEAITEFIITLRVPLPRRAAHTYWESLGWAIHWFTQSLPPGLQLIADERIAINVEYNNAARRI